MQVVDELYASDYVGHWTGLAPTIGLEEFKAFLKSGRARVPDHNEEIEQIVAEGDLVVTRFSSRGTFKGEPGVPPDGKKINVQEIAIHRIVDGKIAEQWTVQDQLRKRQQLGTLCPPLEGGGQQ
jgi:predicted ester cyclase